MEQERRAMPWALVNAATKDGLQRRCRIMLQEDGSV